MITRNAWRWLAPVLFALSAHGAGAAVTGGIIVQTAERVDYQFTVTGTEVFSSVFSDGPWTITLSSPVPTGEPGANFDWSVRLTIEYAGLGGERTDYLWGIGSYLYGYDIENVSGELALATIETGFGASWPVIDGMHRVTVPQPIPEPGTLALLSLGLAGLAASRRHRQ
jgi:hypothetical protein